MTTGPIRIFLDDDRDPPKGWTLVKTTALFVEALDAADPARLEAIAFDWHLGKDVPNANGALDALIERMRARPERFAALERVHFHSSDPDEAAAMARRFADFIREMIRDGRADDLMAMPDVSMPWNEQD